MSTLLEIGNVAKRYDTVELQGPLLQYAARHSTSIIEHQGKDSDTIKYFHAESSIRFLALLSMIHSCN